MVISTVQYSLVVVEAYYNGYQWWLLVVANLGLFENSRLTGINPPKKKCNPQREEFKEQTWVNEPTKRGLVLICNLVF